MNKYIIGGFLIMVSISSCIKEEIVENNLIEIQPLTKSILPEVFDWENADWMPTPPGQAQIPMPWGGQGSISAFYGPDVVYDFKRVNGWRLVYSSFRDNGEELIDPYFMLYNIYRGTLRIYFYLTDPYIGSSTYLQDALILGKSSSASTNLLNYLGGNIVNRDINVDSFTQIQPKMPSGGAPLTGRRWYMIEYEMAYDPYIDYHLSDQFYLTWHLDYYDIDSLKLDGTHKAEIFGTIGGANNTLTDAATSTGKGVVSILGLELMESLTLSDSLGTNKIGLNNSVFKALKDGLNAAVNSFGSGIPELAFNVLSAIISGTTTTSPPSVSLKVDADLEFTGSKISRGAVSSTPIEFKIPGTEIPSTAPGYLPLYTEPLGVFYLDGNINVNITETITVTELEDDIMGTGTYRVYSSRVLPSQQDYSQYLVINPAVTRVANVSVVSQEVLVKVDNVLGGDSILDFPLTGTLYDNPWESDAPIPDIRDIFIRYIVKVQPKDGSPASFICKSFYVDNYTWNTRYVYI